MYAYCTNITYNIIIIIISADLKKEFHKMYLMLNIINKKKCFIKIQLNKVKLKQKMICL